MMDERCGRERLGDCETVRQKKFKVQSTEFKVDIPARQDG